MHFLGFLAQMRHYDLGYSFFGWKKLPQKWHAIS